MADLKKPLDQRALDELTLGTEERALPITSNA
jgi:hypothetical protein